MPWSINKVATMEDDHECIFYRVMNALWRKTNYIGCTMEDNHEHIVDHVTNASWSKTKLPARTPTMSAL